MERESGNVSEIESGENIPTSELETGSEILANESENPSLPGSESESGNVCLSTVESHISLSTVESDISLSAVESDISLTGIDSNISLRGVESDIILPGNEPGNGLPPYESENASGAVPGNISHESYGPHLHPHFQPNGNLDDNYARELLENTMLRQRERVVRMEILNLRSQLKNARNQLGIPDPDDGRRASGDFNHFPSTPGPSRLRVQEDPFINFDLNRGAGLNIAERFFIWLAHNHLHVLARIKMICHRSLQFAVGNLAGFILSIFIRRFGYSFIFGLCGGTLMIRSLVNRKYVIVDWKKILDKLQPANDSTSSDTDRSPDNDLRARGLEIANQRFFQAQEFIAANPFLFIGIVTGLIYKSFLARRR